MIQLQELQAWNINIPLKFQFSQSNNSTSESDTIILKLKSNQNSTGFGECCPRLYVTGESAQSVLKDIEHIRPFLLQYQFNTFGDIKTLVTQILPNKIGLSSICAIELALLDLWSKSTSTNLLEVMGGTEKIISYSGIIPLLKTKYLGLVFQQLKVFGFQKVKLKVDTRLEENLEKIKLIQSELGQNMEIRVDANTSWTKADAFRLIPAYLEHGIKSFEQIFPKGQEAELAELTNEFGQEAAIMVDESLTSFESAKELIENGYCNAFNIKISKTGGIYNALEIYDYAKQHGVSCQLGAHFGETSLLTRAGILFASLSGELTAYEGGFGSFLLQEDLSYTSIHFDQNGSFPIGKLRDYSPLDIKEERIEKYLKMGKVSQA